MLEKWYSLDECTNKKLVVKKLKDLESQGKIEYSIEKSTDIFKIEDLDLEDLGLEGDGLEDGGELSDSVLGVCLAIGLAIGLAGLESDELELFEELLSLFEFFTSEKPSLYFD